ncbi:G8 domain-containing protein [Methanobacterium spitsbergense]|uniref:G8 domain-containing protein n=1 Tax=Methanobacterium spitsbergense TaxID=2874285 RepID=A0A8T5UTI8_9EURY|nr:G8 domain-containing protein [Methanobacterium spitsbergense]MBZ2167024.1 G8 domain-containing protein [Methanobacterium spitsbergense]
MATRTASVSGNWSNITTWGGSAVPINGDAVVIDSDVEVLFDVDETVFTGLASMDINGIFHVKPDMVTCLKMNGNIISTDGTGALYIGKRLIVSDFSLTTDKTNVYEVARTLLVGTVEETLGVGFNNALDILVDIAVDNENIRLKSLGEDEMMLDISQEFRVNYRSTVSLSTILNYIEDHTSTYYYDETGNNLYIHTSDSSNPSTKTITVIEPINRPAAGSESRCQLIFNSTGTINIPTIRMYGWYPDKEFTQLDADADLNATQIVLKEDLGLQAGDKIGIGCGTVNGQLTETAKGYYTVSSYNAETKTVTLTAGLQTARLINDYVCIGSRPIKISRTSGTVEYITTKIDNIVLIGVLIDTYLVRYSALATSVYTENTIINHCTSSNKSIGIGFINSQILNTTRVGGASSSICGKIFSSIIDNCVSISGVLPISGGFNSIITDCICQNNDDTATGMNIKNCIFKNLKMISDSYNKTRYKNCEFSSAETITEPTSTNYICTAIFESCIFKENTIGYFPSALGIKLFNCLFEGTELQNYKWVARDPSQIIESFDHNQIVGNYKAWMKGGKIITENNRLKFICESSSYPVFRDYKILVQKNKIERFRIIGIKDFTGGTIKAELIDPANDPLIDPTATPLVTSSMADIKDTDVSMNINYKSLKAQELILRISAKNNTGNYILKELVRFNRRSREVIQ